MTAHLTEMILARDDLGQHYKGGHRALKEMLQDRNQLAQLTFKKNVDWSRYSVSDLEELVDEVNTQVRLIRNDLTTHPKE